MHITVIGTGYVGLVTAAGLASLGNDVTCLDIDEKKIKVLRSGKVPFFEPGLDELLQRTLEQDLIHFTTDYKEACKENRIVFLCLPTPEKPNGDANLDYMFSAIESAAPLVKDGAIFVTKSTVPVGTNKRLRRRLRELTTKKTYVVSNPEFLREGAAVKDFQNPDRIVIGGVSSLATKVIVRLFKPLERVQHPIMVTTPENAELIKYASNSMLATRISFMNELASLCELVGADIKEIARGMGLDNRIGPKFLQAGAGYGGSCFPKDVKALAYSMEQRGLKANLLRSVDNINEVQKRSLVPKLKTLLPQLHGKRIAIWGLSFKPRTDDVRNSVAFDVIDQLTVEGSDIVVFDPEALQVAKKVLKDKVTYAENMYDTLKGAHALIICTEWDIFRTPDFKRMRSLMKKPFIIDGRNVFSPGTMREHKFKHIPVGRKTTK